MSPCSYVRPFVRLSVCPFVRRRFFYGRFLQNRNIYDRHLFTAYARPWSPFVKGMILPKVQGQGHNDQKSVKVEKNRISVTVGSGQIIHSSNCSAGQALQFLYAHQVSISTSSLRDLA